MTSTRAPRRGWLAVAALFALLCRIAVPQGMMLAPAADGITIAICTGGGVVSATLDVDSGKHAPPADRDTGCAFALSHAPATAPAMIVARVDAPPIIDPAPASPAVTVGRGLAAPPPPSTGPPALA